MMHVYHTENIKDISGNRFRIEHYYDTDAGYPWEEDGEHGPVSDWVSRKKRPGELVLDDDGLGCRRYYDFQAAMRMARDDDWNSVSYYLPPDMRGEEYARLVGLDYQRLRDWCRNKWHYMGIVVLPIAPDGTEYRDEETSIWGIASDAAPTFIQEMEDRLLDDLGAEFCTGAVYTC